MSVQVWLVFVLAVGGMIVALILVRRRSRRLARNHTESAPDITALKRRQCPFCGEQLRHLSGYERDYSGATREVDDFKCRNCRRRFRHIVNDNITTFYEWWGVKTGWDEWSDLFEGSER